MTGNTVINEALWQKLAYEKVTENLPDDLLSKSHAFESEIPREVIEAGLLHLYLYHPEHGVSDEDTVRRIFLAMLDVSLRAREKTKY